MRIDNPFILNDFKIRTFFIVILCLHLMLWGALGLDFLGFKLPLLRQIIGFIYLTFVPGIVAVRVLKLHKLDNVELLLYTVGLSVLTVMLTVLFTNELGMYLGFRTPISTLSSLISLNIIVLILCFFCYVLDKDFSSASTIDINKVLSPNILFLSIIPFISIFGTYLVNFHNNNILLMCLIVLLVSIFIFIAWDKFIPGKLYPYCLFIFSISLLYHNSLISLHLTGWDIHYEYYFSSLVNATGFLDLKFPANIAGMLSIVILAPTYSNVCNLDLEWVFKIIYPFIFSIIPVGIYRIYQKQVNEDKIAFFSVFYFISVYIYYTEMVSLARQQIAELFFVLIILVMVSNHVLFKKRILLTLFSFGMVMSHYGLSYLFLLSIIVGYLFMKYYFRYNSDTYNANFIIMFFTFVIFWYILFTSGTIFESIISLFSRFWDTMLNDILSTEAGAAKLITGRSVSLSGSILKLLYLTSQFFIVMGVFESLSHPKKFNFSKEYISISISLLFALIVSLFNSATGMNIHRLYHINSIVLSLFCVIGAGSVFNLIGTVGERTHSIHFTKHSLKILSIFLVLFMAFNVGFVQEVFKDEPQSISLSQDRMRNSGEIYGISLFYGSYFPVEDIYGAGWLSKYRNSDVPVYYDLRSSLVLLSYGSMPPERLLSNTSEIKEASYVYLRYPNVKYNWMNGPTKEIYWNLSDISTTLNSRSILYSNGGNKIYL